MGIIGGSGVYDLPGIEDVRERAVSTPWGEPSDRLRVGRVGTTEVVFLPRHGRGHRIPPHEINYRANVDALKQMGVTDLVSFSACGSYREELSPGTFVLVDNFFDPTVHRASTFFGTGCVAHVSLAHPVGPALQDRVERAVQAEGIPYRRGGVAVCMEGPQFSTLPESLGYQRLGYDIIHMTSMPEARLAREAEITYAVIAMVTDYDCWHEVHGAVDVASPSVSSQSEMQAGWTQEYLLSSWRPLDSTDLKFSVAIARYFHNGVPVQSNNDILNDKSLWIWGSYNSVTPIGNNMLRVSVPANPTEFITYDRTDSIDNPTSFGEVVYQDRPYWTGGKNTYCTCATTNGTSIILANNSYVLANGSTFKWSHVFSTDLAQDQYIVVTSLNHDGSGAHRVNVRRVIGVSNTSSST